MDDPILGNQNNEDQNVEERSDEIPLSGNEVGEDRNFGMDLNRKGGERKEKINIDPRVEKLNEVMDEVGQVPDFMQPDVMKQVLNTNSSENGEEPMIGEINENKKVS